ncbi:retrovirus-related pol polyprotein from transposon TNT 1-94 [Tanacetum coccineum]
METIHVTFDALTSMTSKQFSSGLGLQSMTPATSSSGLVPNPVSKQLFLVAATPRAIDLADSHVPTSIDQDASSISIPSTQEQEQSLIISQGVEESSKTPYYNDDPLHETLHEDSTSQGSSSNVWPSYTPFELLEAMLEPSWIDAMQEEIHESERLQVWELVQCPDLVMLINLKWIFIVKKDKYGGVLKNKARLVAKEHDNLLDRCQNGILEVVYVFQLEGFVDPDKPNHVYRLKKALYGLKRAPRAWYDMLSSFLLSQEFSKGAVDPILFTRKAGHDILLKYGMLSTDSVNTPMVDKTSRPNLVFAVCMCARYQAKPTEKHLHAVKQIFRYLKGTIDMGLWYSKDFSNTLTTHADADHAGCQDTRQSTSGSA